MNIDNINNIDMKLKFVQRRALVLLSLVLLFFSLLIVRVVDLHWMQANVLGTDADIQRQKAFTFVAPRGEIIDSNGYILAHSVQVPSLAAYGSQIDEEHIPALAVALAITPAILRRRLQRVGAGFVWLSRQMTPQQAKAVTDLKITKGLVWKNEWKRYQPLGPVAGHILGFVGIDGQGLEGMEYALDNVLQPRKRRMTFNTDARRQILPGGALSDSQALSHNKSTNSATNMNDVARVALTIDSNIQNIAYSALANAVRKHKAIGGSVVVLRPRDGAVLALANWPGFNPNNYRNYNPSQWRNRALTDVYEPGSVLKPFTIAAAMQLSDHWQADSMLFCENGNMQVADYPIRDVHARGWLDIRHVLAKSSNIGAAKLAIDIGALPLRNMLWDLGFGHRSKIGMPGEVAGILPPIKQWGPVETATIAFGQGIAVTSLQLASAYGALANGGFAIQPRLLADAPIQSQRVLAVEVSQQVLSMLELAVSDEGTGKRARLDGYRVGGKTGTAQKPDNTGGYAQDRFVATFAGVAPIDNPKLVIVVMIDEPQDMIYGGQVAAPVFQKIAANTLPYLGVTPTQSQTPQQWHAVQVISSPKQTHLYKASSNNSVHSLYGMSLREVGKDAAKEGYTLKTHGRGWVVRQSVKLIKTVNNANDTNVEVWLHE
ncbi:MAG: penicillin-binding transpeptidase domain-containing protein [Mariprofundales bacterium]